MIARANTPAGNKRFRRACRGVPCLGALLLEERALFGRSQPGRFYAGPSLALDIGGTDALAAGGPVAALGTLYFSGDVRRALTFLEEK